MSELKNEENLAELSVRAILLSVILTLLLAMSNAYLALKLGILTSASIPAAIISMGVLRFFKKPSILENNAVQTAASAGEAVAGGIVYTIPALIMIGYWNHFDYFSNFFIAISGGILGVLFSIPLRRILVNDKSLKFPEGQAIAEVLKSSRDKTGIFDLIFGGIIGATLEFLQTGLKLLANSWSHWFVKGQSLFGFGAGFSATMIGAGYLVGHQMAISIFIGALISWVFAMPVLSQFYPDFLLNFPVEQAASMLWNKEMRYLGIGAMLCAGVWTMIKLAKPLIHNIRLSFKVFYKARDNKQALPRTDKDIPLPYILFGVCTMAALLFLFFQFEFPLPQAGLDGDFAPTLVFLAVIYVLVVGFLFSVITAYFSGMVGVTASPGSSIIIAGILFIAWLLLALINWVLPLPLTPDQLKAAEAITIIIGSVVTGIAAIANDNTQDLKVGQLVGATPWKQQVMLLLGVTVSSLVIPPVMELLFNVYGIAGVVPRGGMDLANSLPAPTAALLSAVTEAVFSNTLPWMMMLMGAVIILIFVLANNLQRRVRVSILGVAIGMYLPLSSSVPLFLGGMIAMFVAWHLKHQKPNNLENIRTKQQTGTLIACGLVAGSALMDIVLAIPFSLMKSPNALSIVSDKWQTMSVILSVLAIILLGIWIDRRVCRVRITEETSA